MKWKLQLVLISTVLFGTARLCRGARRYCSSSPHYAA